MSTTRTAADRPPTERAVCRVPSVTAGGRRQTGGIVRIAGCQELS